MSVIHGEGEYRYKIINDWAKVPPGMAWREVGSIAIDHQDQVYVFNRGPHPVMVFDREGNFLRSWGGDLFTRAHGIAVDSHGDVYIGEVSATAWPRLKPDAPVPDPLHALRKMIKVA